MAIRRHGASRQALVLAEHPEHSYISVAGFPRSKRNRDELGRIRPVGQARVRLGRRVSPELARPSGAGADAAGRDRRCASRGAARRRGSDGSHHGGFPAHRDARHYPLAASSLLRLFPGQRRAAVDAGRDAGLDHRRAVHALADIASGHRTRGGHDRLAAAGLVPADGLYRRDPGQRLFRHAVGGSHDARACNRLHRQPGRSGRQGQDPDLLLGPGSQLDRSRGLGCRDRAGEPGQAADARRAIRPRCRCAARGDRPGSRGRARTCRHHRDHRRHRRRRVGRTGSDPRRCAVGGPLHPSRRGVGGLGNDLPGVPVGFLERCRGL